MVTCTGILSPQPIRRESLAGLLFQQQGFVGRGSPSPTSDHTSDSASVSLNEISRPYRLLHSPLSSATGTTKHADDKVDKGHNACLDRILKAGSGNAGETKETLNRALVEGSQFLAAEVFQACHQVGGHSPGAGLNTGSMPFASSPFDPKGMAPGSGRQMPNVGSRAKVDAPTRPEVQRISTNSHTTQGSNSSSIITSSAATLNSLRLHVKETNGFTHLHTLPLECDDEDFTSAHASPISSSSGRGSRCPSGASGFSYPQYSHRPSGATDHSTYSRQHGSDLSHSSLNGSNGHISAQIRAAGLRNPLGSRNSNGKTGHDNFVSGPAQQTINGFDALGAADPAQKRRGLPFGPAMMPKNLRQEAKPMTRQPSGLRHTGTAKAHYADPNYSSFRRAPPRKNSRTSHDSQACSSRQNSGTSHHSDSKPASRRPSASHSAHSHGPAAQAPSRRPSAATDSSRRPSNSGLYMRRSPAPAALSCRPAANTGPVRQVSVSASSSHQHWPQSPTTARCPSVSVAPEIPGSRFANVHDATNGRPRRNSTAVAAHSPLRRRSSSNPATLIKDTPIYTRAYLKRCTKYPLPKGLIPHDFVMPTHGFPRFCPGRKEDGTNHWNFCLQWRKTPHALLRCMYCAQFIPEEEEGDPHAAATQGQDESDASTLDWCSPPPTWTR